MYKYTNVFFLPLFTISYILILNLYLAGITNDCEDPYPSLSDYHDYEPNLEFDDTELQTTSNNGNISSNICLILSLCYILYNYFIAAVQLLEEKLDLANSGTGTGIDYLESPVSDGTIEENFEEALVDAPVIESGV